MNTPARPRYRSALEQMEAAPLRSSQDRRFLRRLVAVDERISGNAANDRAQHYRFFPGGTELAQLGHIQKRFEQRPPSPA